MTDNRHTHARKPEARAESAEHDEAGFDVWLPLLAALVAAIVLLLPVKAAEFDAPRPIYDAARFAMSEAERTALEEETARAADAIAATRHRLGALAASVEMQALPVLSAAEAAPVVAEVTRGPVASPPVLIAAREVTPPSSGWVRIAMALAIAAMLGGALYLLDRTWRRTGPAPMPAPA